MGRVDENELKEFFKKQIIKKHGENYFDDPNNVRAFESGWGYMVDLFDPAEMYVKNLDGTFTVKDEFRFDKIRRSRK
jgi:hypothetical protein